MGSSVWAGLPIFVVSRVTISSMGFFSFLFGRSSLAALEDAFFGQLTLDGQGGYGSAYCFYAEKVMFHPIGTTIECMLHASDATGPTLTQRTFFQQVEQLYAGLLPEIIATVENDSQLLAIGSSFVGFASTHRLAGIAIPASTSPPVNWEIWFEPIDTSHWGYSVLVDMVDDIPQEGIGISA